jgi:Tol biopolymer transport system component
MKRLLSLVAVAALVAAMLPGTGIAGLRGAFEPIGRGDLGDNFGNGLVNGLQQLAQRPVPAPAGNGYAILERWYAFSTRSQVVGQETSREIWQAMNRATPGLLVADINDARRPILKDDLGLVSYADPAWSPNGRFLAYTVTNAQVTEASIYVQEYLTSNTMNTAVTTVGSPILVVAGGPSVRNRHADWSPDGNSIAFDSDAAGSSIDVYTVQVFPTVGVPVRKTFVANRSEQNPAWNPAGDKLAYDTNHFGPNIIEIVDVNTLAVTLAETNFAAISHSNPDWSSDGNSIYYDAPENEDAVANPDIWKLDLPTQAKCPIHMDGAGDVNPAISSFTNVTGGVSFNTFIFESQAFPPLGQPGLRSWRANPVQTCVPPLPMAIQFAPTNVNFNNGQNLKMTLSFPAEVQALGYIMNPGFVAAELKGRDGVRFRAASGAFSGGLFPSPLVQGISPVVSDAFGLPLDSYDNNKETVTCSVNKRALGQRLTALGLTSGNVPVEVTAYTNNAGRSFRGFGYIHVSGGNGAGAIALAQNSPNPFNPSTKIRFATSKAGNVSLRIFNVRGELVKTIVNERMNQGSHEVSWDGRATSGQTVSSGVYYAKASVEGGASDVIKMVVAK